MERSAGRAQSSGFGFFYAYWDDASGNPALIEYVTREEIKEAQIKRTWLFCSFMNVLVQVGTQSRPWRGPLDDQYVRVTSADGDWHTSNFTSLRVATAQDLLR